jgi:hypothetical protein
MSSTEVTMDTRSHSSQGDAASLPAAPANDVHHHVRAEILEIVEIVEIVEIEIYGRENRPPPPAKAYKVKIDHDHFVFETRHVTGRELLVKAGKTPPEHYEIEKRVHGGQYVPVGLDQPVDRGEPGIEVFETFPLDETEG